MKPKILFAVYKERFSMIFSQQDIDRITSCCDVIETEIPESPDAVFLRRHIKDANIVISSWTTARFDEQILQQAENLKMVVHAAGSVKPVVSDALWKRRIRVASCSAALAFGVAEFCLGLILTAPKRVFWSGQGTKQGKWREGTKAFNGPFEIYKQKIGIIGAGHIGRILIKLLKNFDCDILLYDPFCDKKKAVSMGARKVESLERLFSECKVVSLHAPSNESTKGMINGSHFKLLQDGAVFINTARGAVINENDMVEELRKERFVACIDVTDPEPPASDSPLRSLPNVLLTPHEAGVIAENMRRIGALIAEQVECFVKGEDVPYEVTQKSLSRMA